MSDETTTAPTTEAPAETPAQENDLQAQVERIKSEARKWETRAKENSAAAKRLAEIEEASKTETQKLAERAEAAERALAEAQADALRSKVIAKHAIPEDYHEFVVGATEEELTAKAEKVQKLIAAQSESATTTRHVVVADEGKTPALALNGDGIESALKNALGIQ